MDEKRAALFCKGFLILWEAYCEECCNGVPIGSRTYVVDEVSQEQIAEAVSLRQKTV